MPASTVFWVVVPPLVLLILTVIFYAGSGERS